MLKITYAKLSEFKLYNLSDLIKHYNLPLKSQSKINSYYQIADRYRALISEIFKYNIMANLLDISPLQINILEDKYYRPYLGNKLAKQFDFNISHSGDYIIIAVSNVAKVGVDIEFIDQKIDYSSLKLLTFSKREVDLIRSALEFFNLWAKKEALIKVVGKGFLDDMYLNTKLNHDPRQVYSYGSINYKFCELNLDINYKTYLCYTIIDNLDHVIEIKEYKPL